MKVPRSSFARNVLTLLGGTAIAQAIPLLASPFLARLFSPEQVGALGLMLAVANPLSLLVCGRYELTVVLPRVDDRANELARLGLSLAVVTSLVLGLLIVLFRGPLSGLIGGEEAMFPLLMAIPLFLLMGFFQPLNNWLIRKQAFRAMSVNKLVQTSGITLVSLALGWWAVEHGLLVAYLCGWVLYAVVGMVQARRKGMRFLPIDLTAMRHAARHYRDFPLYNALPAVLNTATLSIPVLALSRIFGEESTGQFNLCRQVVFLPVTFFATSFMQVYMQRASSAVAGSDPVLPSLRRSVKLLGGLGFLLALVLILAGPALFGIAFGERWTEAGGFARILAVPIALQFTVVPLTVLMPALGRVRELSVWQVVYFLAVLACAVGKMGSADAYLIRLAVAESLAYLALMIYILHSARRHDRIQANA